MFSTDLLFAIKRDAYIFEETGWVCRFAKHQKLDKWAMAAENRQTCLPKLHTETYKIFCFLEDTRVPFDCKQQISTKN